MTTLSISVNREQLGGSAAENHKRAEDYLLAAEAHHFKAARYLNEGNYEKAAESALFAKEYLGLASEAKREDIATKATNPIKRVI
jgi:hypothetical protein